MASRVLPLLLAFQKWRMYQDIFYRLSALPVLDVKASLPFADCYEGLQGF